MMFRSLIRILPLLLMGCLGGATETETGTAMIRGKTQWPDGSPAIGARVRLRPDGFLAGFSGAVPPGGGPWDTVTDAAGRYSFPKVATGDYTVEALSGEGRGAFARFDIQASGESFDLETLVLRSTALVTGRVRYADSSRAPAVVQVPGTAHAAVADSSTGVFYLWDMPPGDFGLRVSASLPFFPAKDFPVRVEDGSNPLDLGDLILDKGPKQEFAIGSGILSLAGIGPGNPILYDNDFCSNTWDNEFLWALASGGRIDLRGNLATRIMRDSTLAFPEDFSAWDREAEICRLAGMRNIPQTLSGATRKLSQPAGGRWEDIVPESNPGIRLLIAEARKASAEKPLIVLEGGTPTTVANAVLLDPSIADKMVIFGIYNQDLNGRDSLATFLVAKKCRFVEWGRDYRWAGPGPSSAAIAANRLGMRLAAERDTAKSAKDFFADFAGLSFLANADAWKGARGAYLASAPMNVKPDGQGPFDFIDIPQEANDWRAMDSVFFSVFADPAAYHPWPVPGVVAGVSFRGMAGISADSAAGEGDFAADIGAGDWMEYSLEIASAGEYDLVLRYQCAVQAQVRAAARDAASQADLQLTAGAAWGEAQVRLHLEKGPQTLRLTTAAGAWKLARMEFRPAP